MLKEISKEDVERRKGETHCRWFRDDYFDLFVWTDDFGNIESFQLCYDIYGNQRALNWKSGAGYSHYTFDDGARPGKVKATPLMGTGGHFEPGNIANEFKVRADGIDPQIIEFICNKILDYREHH